MLLGKAPDVFMVQPDDFNTFSSIGALKSLDGMIAQDGSFKTNNYYAAAYNSGKYQGGQYALPFESVPAMMFVNKTLLNREGITVPADTWTWKDFYAICKQVTRDTNGDGRIDQFGCYDYTWKTAAYSNGASIFNTDGTECYLNDPKAVAAIQFVKDLTGLSGSTPPTSREFDLGQVAFRPFLFSDYRTYKPYPWSIKKYSSFEWDCIRMPAGPNGGNISELNTLLMGISSKTRNSRLAWEFLKMLTADEATQQEIFKYSPGVSVLKHVTESAKTRALLSQDTPGGQELNVKTLDEVMNSAVTIPRFRKYSGVIQLADSRISELITGSQELGPALTTLKRDILNYMQQ
jgi:multiple sugar transport system substrate-binding protein